MRQQPTAGRPAVRARRPAGVQGRSRPVQSSGVTTRLADIAAQAGVSEATVSRVLNGKPGVAATTRQSVLAALDVLGYERPVRLRQRSEGLVGLITPELENPIFPALAQVIGQALTRQGYTPVLATQTPGGSTEDELTEMLVDRGVAGSSTSPGCTPTPPPTCSATSGCGRGACRSCWWTGSRRGCRRRSSPPTTARR
ncbi:hypothetical protein Srubr_18010 [Streptomyces rubradiris]|uniref:HTH lacI-type domain-containing protein n=1 Tax=Streptomyces rubradiris TaxID=285531 RepID=A0ABQ3R7X5_STRRR|nr:hypothetical protein Srubr_18010 [Streptomyces rubradiris]